MPNPADINPEVAKLEQEAKAAGLSIPKLCKGINMSRATYQRKKYGESPLTTDDLMVMKAFIRGQRPSQPWTRKPRSDKGTTGRNYRRRTKRNQTHGG